jgi:hypothetical protein
LAHFKRKSPPAPELTIFFETLKVNRPSHSNKIVSRQKTGILPLHQFPGGNALSLPLDYRASVPKMAKMVPILLLTIRARLYAHLFERLTFTL